jgi:spore coat protein U-like protein
MRWSSTLAVSVFASALATGAPLRAGSASATLEVSYVVQPGCSVSAGPLAFTGSAGSRAEAEAAIDVRCSCETAVAVSLDQGRHAAGSQRRLASESGVTVAYQIYSDAARTQAWGGSAIARDAGPDGALRMIAYGRIESRDAGTGAGEYRDSVTVTVAF